MKNPNCEYCKSNKVIKHGRTATGNPRYRCRNCGKTWVLEKNEPPRPDIWYVTEAYLSGRTCRELVSIYHSSPLRINQKVREFLEGCPSWEEYLDACVPFHETKIIYLVGRNFACSSGNTKNNEMFVAIAVDGLSSAVVGFEVGESDCGAVWQALIGRLKNRGFKPQAFMSNGARIIEDAIITSFPNSELRINYHRAYREKEIQCCLNRLPINNKLVNDAIKVYNILENKNLTKYLKELGSKKMHEIVLGSQEEFVHRLKERFADKTRLQSEGLAASFQTRFEKFHMLKGDPIPVINGWIARQMLFRLPSGFSRLSLYCRQPVATSFKQFSCGNLPLGLNLLPESDTLRHFVIEIAARGLQLPILCHKCEMRIDNCSLF